MAVGPRVSGRHAKPSSAAVQQAIATGCSGPATAWHPAIPLSPGLLRSAGPFSLRLRAGIFGGPLGALVSLPHGSIGQLSSAAPVVTALVTQGSVLVDPGQLLWHSTLHARHPLIVGAGVYQLTAPTSTTATLLAHLYSSATTPAGVANLWNFICHQPGASGYIVGCSAFRTSQSAVAHGVTRVAAGSASIATGGAVGLTLRRSHAVAPGLYVTTMTIRPAGRGASARLLLRPYLVTAAQLAQPLGH